MIVRTTEWDGPAPAEGDVLMFDDGDVAVVEHAIAGAGIGHWTLHVSPRRLLAFHAQR